MYYLTSHLLYWQSSYRKCPIYLYADKSRFNLKIEGGEVSDFLNLLFHI